MVLLQTYIEAVGEELERARAKYPEQEHNVDLWTWLAILTEEVGEVARELNEFSLNNIDRDELVVNITEELVQVGAMACRMALAANCQETSIVPISELIDANIQAARETPKQRAFRERWS